MEVLIALQDCFFYKFKEFREFSAAAKRVDAFLKLLKFSKFPNLPKLYLIYIRCRSQHLLGILLALEKTKYCRAAARHCGIYGAGIN